MTPSRIALYAAGERSIYVHGESTLSFRFYKGKKTAYTWNFVVADIDSGHYDCLIGMDFLTAAGAPLDLAEGHI